MLIQELLKKPVWQMTGEELLFIQNIARQPENNAATPVMVETKPEKKYEYGIRGIARIFGCFIPTANRIKKSGRIDAAITQIGRKIIVDVELALKLTHDKSQKKGGR